MPGNGSWNSAGTEKIADGEMGKDHLWELGVPGMGILGQAGPKMTSWSQAGYLWSEQASSHLPGMMLPALQPQPLTSASYPRWYVGPTLSQ